MKAVFLFFFLAPTVVLAQSKRDFKGRIFRDLSERNSITKSFGDSVFHFHVKDIRNDQSVKVYDRRFHWFHQGVVNSTLASYTGKVLHGEFLQFDAKGNLMEKGTFKRGTKEGLWLKWYKDGSLSGQYRWKNGFRDGRFKEYFANGVVRREGCYFHDRLNGKLLVYSADGVKQSKEIYRKGILQPVKKRSTRAERKAKRQTDSLLNPIDSTEKKKWQLFRKSKRKKDKDGKKD